MILALLLLAGFCAAAGAVLVAGFYRRGGLIAGAVLYAIVVGAVLAAFNLALADFLSIEPF